MLNRLRRLRHATHWRRARPAQAACALPQGADVDGLLQSARQSFLRQQATRHRADLDALDDLATAKLPTPGGWHEAPIAGGAFWGLLRERHERAPALIRGVWTPAQVKAAGRGCKLAQAQSLS